MTQNVQQRTSLYQRLDASQRTIRLLEVLPYLEDGRVQCRLSTHQLNDNKFVVLSYRWGDLTAAHEIVLNGQIFYVRQNLWSFLNVIREQSGILLWIDALCINQEDVEERNQQVRIMGQIFRSASMVLSWLGSGNARIEQAFELMHHVWSSSDAQETSDRLPIIRSGQSEDDLWKCVVEVCNHLYWGRVWVVQEILLSSNNYLLCGNQTLPWQVFANFVSLVDVRFTCPPLYTRAIHDSTAKSYATSKPYAMVPRDLQWRIGSALRHDYGRAWDTDEFNLFRILTMFGDRDCTDPLDHVYALLSLTWEGDNFPISYGIDRIQLFLTVIHFCGQSESTQSHDAGTQSQHAFKPASQRAFIRNTKYLAETMELIPTHQRTSPYFHGASTSARGPSPRPDPSFPRVDQPMILQCSSIEPGNEPPVLRSNTLKRSMEDVQFDTMLHLNESSSWLLCRNHVEKSDELTVAAIITIKDSLQGRGFKILSPGKVSTSTIRRSTQAPTSAVWEVVVRPEAHLDLLKVVTLGIQPN